MRHRYQIWRSCSPGRWTSLFEQCSSWPPESSFVCSVAHSAASGTCCFAADSARILGWDFHRYSIEVEAVLEQVVPGVACFVKWLMEQLGALSFFWLWEWVGVAIRIKAVWLLDCDQCQYRLTALWISLFRSLIQDSLIGLRRAKMIHSTHSYLGKIIDVPVEAH